MSKLLRIALAAWLFPALAFGQTPTVAGRRVSAFAPANPLSGSETLLVDQTVQGQLSTRLTTLQSIESLLAAQILTPAQLGSILAASPQPHKFLTGMSAGGAFQASQPSASDVSGLAASATVDTTNAGNIGSGTLASARLPYPTSTAIGGVLAATASQHQFLTGVSPTGTPTFAQPGAGDISGLATSATTDTTNAANIGGGTLAGARLPAFTGDCSTTTGGVNVSCANLRSQANNWTAAQLFSGTSGILGGAGGSNLAIPVGKDGSNGYLRFVPGGTKPGYLEFDPVTGPRVGYLGYADGNGNLQMSGPWVRDTQPAVPSNDGTIDTTANSQNRLSHVPNNSGSGGLTTWTNYAFSVMRDDVGVVYKDTGASCAAADGGAQIQPVSGHCWKADISGGISALLWSPPMDGVGDARPAIQAGLSALGLLGGGTLVVPYNPNGWLLNSGIVVPGGVSLQLQRNAFFNVNFAAGDVVTLGGLHPGAENLIFYNKVNRTSGAAVEVNNADFAYVHNTRCKRPATPTAGFQSFICVGVDGGDTNEINSVYVDQEGQSGICIGCQYSKPVNTTIDGQSNFNFQHVAAVNIQAAGGVFMSGVNSDFNQVGLLENGTQSGTGGSTTSSVGAVYSHDNYWDAAFGSSVVIQGTVNEQRMKDWVASAGQGVSSVSPSLYTGTFTQRANAPGLDLELSPAASNNTFDIMAINSTGPGVLINGGRDTHLSGVITQNCTLMANCGGIMSGASIGHWDWSGRIGGTNGLTQAGVPNNQQYGAILGGVPDFVSLRGDFTGNALGAVLGSTGINSTIDVIPAYGGTNYAPAVGSSSSSGFAGTGTAGVWTRRGAIVTVSAKISVTANETGGVNVYASLPMPAQTLGGAGIGQCVARDAGTGAAYQAFLDANNVYLQTAAGGYPSAASSWAANVSCTYVPAN